MTIDAASIQFQTLNEQIRRAPEDVVLENCCGQRFIASGLKGKSITINGTPGNALGAYLDGANIVVRGNAQDATGDTMNSGEIVIHGSTGDAAGYAMRGGAIYVRDNAGYRAGIHMKAYKEKLPVMVIGGRCGSFLGEYQAGGIIIVLGIGCEGDVVSRFCGTGMHGGKIYLRCRKIGVRLPKQVEVREADSADISEIRTYLDRYCELFGIEAGALFDRPFYVLTPNTKNPYKQLYVQN